MKPGGVLRDFVWRALIVLAVLTAGSILGLILWEVLFGIGNWPRGLSGIEGALAVATAKPHVELAAAICCNLSPISDRRHPHVAIK
jgi:hypothetical protein